MIEVSAAEFQRNIGLWLGLALSRTVAITRNGWERTVLISMDEYRRLNQRDRQVLSLHDFTAEDIVALEATRPPDVTNEFDARLI